MLNNKYNFYQANSFLKQSNIQSSEYQSKKMNINITPLSLCSSPSNKSNPQKGQKQQENKPLSAKNNTLTKKLALFQSVSNLKIKDSITKKRKSEQNLLKGIKGDKNNTNQPLNQPFLTQVQQQNHVLQNIFYMTEGDELKESNQDYFQQQNAQKRQNLDLQKNIFTNKQNQNQESYNLQIQQVNFQKLNEYDNISQEANQQGLSNNYLGVHLRANEADKAQFQKIKQFQNSYQMNNEQGLKFHNNFSSSTLILKQKQIENDIQLKKTSNLQTENYQNIIQQQIRQNNNIQYQNKTEQQQSLSPNKSSQQQLKNSKIQIDKQSINNEPDLSNIFKKQQPDYSSIMEMLSNRNKEIQKLSNYKLNLSEKLLELRTQVNQLQNVQKKNSDQDYAEQASNNLVNQEADNKLTIVDFINQQKQNCNTINQDEKQKEMESESLNQNVELNFIENQFKNSMNKGYFQHLNNPNNLYIQGTTGTNDYNSQNQGVSLNMMQSLTNDEIICPLSTKSQGVPTRDNIIQNYKVHHLSNDFGINKENVLFSQRQNAILQNSGKKDQNLNNSNKKKKTNSQPQKVPKQAQVFKFNNIKSGDCFTSSNQVPQNHDIENNLNSQEVNLQPENNIAELVKYQNAPLSSKSVKIEQSNSTQLSQKHFVSVGNQINPNQIITQSNNNNNYQNNLKKQSGISQQFNSQLQQNSQNYQQKLHDYNQQCYVNQIAAKTNVSLKKSSKDFLLDKLQLENQLQQQKLQNKNHSNLNILINNNNNNNQNNLANQAPQIHIYPQTTSSKSLNQQNKVNNNSPIFYKSTIQLSRLNKSKKKIDQNGGNSARLNEFDSHRNNKIQSNQNFKCSTTENSKICRRLSTNDNNIQNKSSENIIMNSNSNKANINDNLSLGNGQYLQDQNLQIVQQQVNSATLSNGNSTYFPLTKKELPQNTNKQTSNNKIYQQKSKNANQATLIQQKLLLSNAQSYTTSNNSTNGNTQHYSSNYQNLSTQAENGYNPLLKSNTIFQQNTNGIQENNFLNKSTPLNQQLITHQDQFSQINAPFNTLKSNSEDIQLQLNQQINQINIQQELDLLKQKMVRVLNKYSNKQAFLENLNKQLIQKFENFQI
ncbi:hypothetical protein TTHERM_00152210 (macronuclear) [Tetrahymena thermophila SB210]|uniref:Uncharacterized protein n=1 Tax=Tetrahymena thermophila (strain SB210) TaxID=312017 RepID=I7MLB1_TETTS|nr:hypothetical protein TTHERM_00152210 [Tetrahymena thermophila SB210]EAS01506.2 hypothetical protein TTHERM_00152210 [Tetrahymena thermophila SB210]|eukprot:XP_001021753.2 hypothetical protein TTHERM_00152210 [Tetrahymena thermophila SB210]